MSAVLDRPPPPPRASGSTRWGAFALALVVHVLLFVLLAVGVSWKTHEPETIEAELWSTIPQVAAPAPSPPVPPPPAPEPPKPMPRVEPDPTPLQPAPDIALEARRKAEEQKQREAEQRALDDKKKREAQRVAEEEQVAREKQAQLDAQKKAAQDKAAKEAREKQFQQNLARMTAQAGTPSTGTAAVTSGPKGDPTYAGRIAQLIRTNTTFTDPGDGIPRAEFAVDLDPTGYVIGVRKTKSSGNANWDAAVERAIHKSEPFPADKSGRPPSSLLITHCPTC